MKSEDSLPEISVIVPCYKQAHYLQEAMASLAAQTYRDFEVVIVDDGSPDETASEVRRLMALYPEIQIRLVSKANGGLPSARNYGIRASRGKFLLPLDADDRLAPVFIERTVAALATHPEASIA